MKDRETGAEPGGVGATDNGWVLRLVDCPCGRPRISSKELFPAGHREICLEHEGMEYCLRITKQNKLILYR